MSFIVHTTVGSSDVYVRACVHVLDCVRATSVSLSAWTKSNVIGINYALKIWIENEIHFIHSDIF